MRFAEALHAKMHAREIKSPLEYPKYIQVDGKSVLVLTEEEEQEKLGIEGHGEPISEAPESDASESAENLLSGPEKRPRGRPVGWRKPVLVSPNPEE